MRRAGGRPPSGRRAVEHGAPRADCRQRGGNRGRGQRLSDAEKLRRRRVQSGARRPGLLTDSPAPATRGVGGLSRRLGQSIFQFRVALQSDSLWLSGTGRVSARRLGLSPSYSTGLAD